MHISPELVVQLVAYLVIVVVFSMKLATKAELKEKVKEREEKIQTVFLRIDEHKRDCNDTFVRKEMCEQMYVHTKEELGKISEDHKDYRHEMAATVGKIFLTIDMIKKDISEVKEIVLKK
jgi:hypothetical protein